MSPQSLIICALRPRVRSERPILLAPNEANDSSDDGMVFHLPHPWSTDVARSRNLSREVIPIVNEGIFG